MENELINIINQIPQLLPLGLIGLYRWSIWLIKKILGLFYKPIDSKIVDDKTSKQKISLIVPVYNEKEVTFTTALMSWVKEKPYEIIAVIDYTDELSIKVFKKFQSRYKSIKTKLIVTEKPGKREALYDGMKVATGDIYALVDSDSIWTDGILNKAKIAFASDNKIGGVMTKQNVHRPNTLAERIFDMLLDIRAHDEQPMLTAFGKNVLCLSGRTAFYRASALKPSLDELVNDYFLGEKMISGDDKRLTEIIQKNGYNAIYQSNMQIYTIAEKKFSTFAKQRIRWARNTIRYSSRAILDGWVLKHPMMTFVIIDGLISKFTLLFGAFLIIQMILNQKLLAVGLVFAWLVFSRIIKNLQHLLNKPSDIAIIPTYIFLSYYLALLNIYAFVTMDKQGWITRWSKNRLTIRGFTYQLRTATLMSIILVALFYFSTFELYTLASPKVEVKAKVNNFSEYIYAIPNNSQEVESYTENRIDELSQEAIIRYEVKSGDTLYKIADKYNLDVQTLVDYNYNYLPNINRLEVGLHLNIPTRKLDFKPIITTNTQIKRSMPILYEYDESNNLIILDARGKVLTLAELAKLDNYEHIFEESPKVWKMTASLELKNGVQLEINDEEVNWLKLESNPSQYTFIECRNSSIYIENTKITSWDSGINNYDEDYNDGRSYILCQGTATMDVINSEIAYLGYKTTPIIKGGTYGLSWRIPTGSFTQVLNTGKLINSNVHHTYFAMYSFGSTGIVIKNNDIHDNVIYGIDPHDDSNNFIVANNKSYRNGHHGIIFSKRCYNNLIINNESYDNGLHGIMLHEKSINNVVAYNTSFNNEDAIAIYDANNNIIYKNNVKMSKTGIRINRDSIDNIVINNALDTLDRYGIYFYDGSKQNYIYENLFNNIVRAKVFVRD